MIKITHLEKHTEEKVADLVLTHLKEVMPTTYFEVKISDGNSNLKVWKNKPNAKLELKEYFKDPHNASAEISREEFYDLIGEDGQK